MNYPEEPLKKKQKQKNKQTANDFSASHRHETFGRCFFFIFPLFFISNDSYLAVDLDGPFILFVVEDLSNRNRKIFPQ